MKADPVRLVFWAAFFVAYAALIVWLLT